LKSPIKIFFGTSDYINVFRLGWILHIVQVRFKFIKSFLSDFVQYISRDRIFYLFGKFDWEIFFPLTRSSSIQNFQNLWFVDAHCHWYFWTQIFTEKLLKTVIPNFKPIRNLLYKFLHLKITFNTTNSAQKKIQYIWLFNTNDNVHPQTIDFRYQCYF
jgi:hypothetical protein